MVNSSNVETKIDFCADFQKYIKNNFYTTLYFTYLYTQMYTHTQTKSVCIKFSPSYHFFHVDVLLLTILYNNPFLCTHFYIAIMIFLWILHAKRMTVCFSVFTLCLCECKMFVRLFFYHFSFYFRDIFYGMCAENKNTTTRLQCT